MRAATGVALAAPFPPPLEGAGGAAGAGPAARGPRSATSPTAIRATTVPVATTSSGAARISTTVPATGDGSSASTLSVETSTRPWSFSTWSPTFTSQSSTVPSETDSPISGTATSMTSPPPSAGGAGGTGDAGREAAPAAVAGLMASSASLAASFSSSAAAPCSASSTADSSAAQSGSASAGAGAAPLLPLGEISPSTVPTGTVSSGSTRIFVRTPLAGDGTSVSTLSVDTSTRPCSASTSSPTWTSHSGRAPSVTASPLRGLRFWPVVPASVGPPGCSSPPLSWKIPGVRASGMKWWGWGREADQPPAETGIAAREHLGFGPAEAESPARVEGLDLRPPRIEPPAALAGICSIDPEDRVTHSLGKAYRDVVRAFRGQIDEPVDVVARPHEENEVRQLLEWCAGAGAAAIPYGGGTSVVGGLEPRGLDAAVSIDLGEFDRVLEVDRDSLGARVQAGVRGPHLAEQLREHGVTLRHYPQSWEFSTLGGWVATRAGGHYATGATHIDDFVESVRAITPGGVWASRRLPGSGAGPSPDRRHLRSAGRPGGFSRASMGLQAPPKFPARPSGRFQSFFGAAPPPPGLAQARPVSPDCPNPGEQEGFHAGP